MVEDVGDDDYGEVVVEFVARSAACLDEASQCVEGVMRGFPIRLFERTLKPRLMNLLLIRQPKLGIDLLNLIHTKRTLIIQLFKHAFILSLVILRLLLNILKLVSFTEFLPVESGIEFH